jgi:hypothetical protein
MYQTIILPHFLREAKGLLKRYPALKNELSAVLSNFDPAGHPHLGQNVYKVRVASKSLQRGKSKGLRLIVLLIEQDGFLVPLTIYYKGSKADIQLKEINHHLEIILLELKFQALSRGQYF